MLFFLQASNEGCLSKAELLSDMHFKDLRTQKSLLGVDIIGPSRVRGCGQTTPADGKLLICLHIVWYVMVGEGGGTNPNPTRPFSCPWPKDTVSLIFIK